MKELECIIECDGYIKLGTAFGSWGSTFEYEPMYKVYGPSRHLTFVFNLFVWL